MEKLLTGKQAAELLQVSQETLRNWEKAGHIETIRVGGIVRYCMDSVIPPTETEQTNES